MKLTVKAIIHWEKLAKKPFSQLDDTSEEDIIKLLYCMSTKHETLEVFTAALESKKVSSEIFKEFRKVMGISKQYQLDDNKEGSTDRYFSDIAGMMIANGIDANFVLTDLEIYDIDILLKGIDEKHRQDMVERRLWTYLSILPHVDAKKTGLTAVKMYPFPWEEESLRKEEAEDLRKSMNVLKKWANGEIQFN